MGRLTDTSARYSLDQFDVRHFLGRHFPRLTEQHRPLNSIGLPYYKERLLSSWTKQFVPNGLLFPAPQKVPQQVLSIMKRVDNVGYAALPKELRGKRNVVTAPKKSQGRFRSVAMQRHEVRAHNDESDLLLNFSFFFLPV